MAAKSPIEEAIASAYVPPRAFFKCQHYEQKTNYTCGTASVRMVVDFYEDGRNYDEDVLLRYLGSQPVVGTEADDVADFFKTYDYHVFHSEGCSVKTLEYFVSRGLPTIINYRNQLGNVGHFAVVVGYTSKALILNDPWNGECHTVDKAEFEKLWVSGDGTKVRWACVPIKWKYFRFCSVDEVRDAFEAKDVF